MQRILRSAYEEGNRETEKLVNCYEVKLSEIREAPVDERPQKLGRLYRISERNKHTGVMITSA